MADRRPPSRRGPGPGPKPKRFSKGSRPGGPPRKPPGKPGAKPEDRPRKPRQERASRPSAPPAEEGADRLQKILAHAGFGSRRACEEIVLQGRVTVDGQVVRELGFRVDPRAAKIAVDGEPVRAERHVYYAVHKPKGYVSTNNDPAGRPRVVDLLPEIPQRVYTVGRLDEQSTGLMLLTNDGELANRLAHPRFGVEKLYRVVVAGSPERAILDKLVEGIWLAEGKVRARRVRPVARKGQATVLELTLAEGKNREIRRMLAKLGHKVMSLTRVAVGPVALRGLPVGECRPLTGREIEQLRQVAAGEQVPFPDQPDRRPRMQRERPARGGGEGRPQTAEPSAPPRGRQRPPVGGPPRPAGPRPRPEGPPRAGRHPRPPGPPPAGGPPRPGGYRPHSEGPPRAGRPPRPPGPPPAGGPPRPGGYRPHSEGPPRAGRPPRPPGPPPAGARRPPGPPRHREDEQEPRQPPPRRPKPPRPATAPPPPPPPTAQAPPKRPARPGRPGKRDEGPGRIIIGMDQSIPSESQEGPGRRPGPPRKRPMPRRPPRAAGGMKRRGPGKPPEAEAGGEGGES